MEYDNPAERLLTLLRTCKGIAPNHNCRKAWQKVLNTEENNALLMARLGKVMELPQITVQALKDSFPNRASTWTHWSSQVNNAFISQNLHGSWDSFINHIDDHSMTYLQMSSDLLHSKSTTKLLGDEELKSIRDELDRLYTETLAASIDEDVKKYLVRYLRKLLVSLDEYRITGALPLLEAVETMVGHAHIDKSYRSFMTDSDLGKRIVDSIGAMANLVTVAVGIPQLTQTIVLLSA
jgi:hypothetical protein